MFPKSDSWLSVLNVCWCSVTVLKLQARLKVSDSYTTNPLSTGDYHVNYITWLLDHVYQKNTLSTAEVRSRHSLAKSVAAYLMGKVPFILMLNSHACYQPSFKNRVCHKYLLANSLNHIDWCKCRPIIYMYFDKSSIFENMYLTVQRQGLIKRDFFFI